jgi:hypothetical protein
MLHRPRCDVLPSDDASEKQAASRQNFLRRAEVAGRPVRDRLSAIGSAVSG